MTEFSQEQDEVASAYLDGEATEDERARVEGDAELLARVDTLRGVRDALAAPTEGPGSSDRDVAIRAAVAASTVVDLGAERARRRLRLISIAAAVLVVLGAAGLLIRSASSNNTKTSSATAAAGSVASNADRGVQPQAGGATGAENIPGAFPLGTREPLGAFADRSTLTDAAKTQVRNRLSVDQRKDANTSTAVAPSAGANGGTGDDAGFTASVPACAVAGPPSSVAEVYAATASLDGRAVQIDVFSLTDDTLTLIVTDASTCTQLFTQSV
jgi:hypothetical protein